MMKPSCRQPPESSSSPLRATASPTAARTPTPTNSIRFCLSASVASGGVAHPETAIRIEIRNSFFIVVVLRPAIIANDIPMPDVSMQPRNRSTVAAVWIAVLSLLWTAVHAQLGTGDVVAGGHVAARYSGESVTWTACAGTPDPGEYAEFEIVELATGQLVSAGSSPLSTDRFVFVHSIPRVGLYSARARACNDADPEPLCSEWRDSEYFAANGSGACGAGPEFVYAVLEPPGPPVLE